MKINIILFNMVLFKFAKVFYTFMYVCFRANIFYMCSLKRKEKKHGRYNNTLIWIYTCECVCVCVLAPCQHTHTSVRSRALNVYTPFYTVNLMSRLWRWGSRISCLGVLCIQRNSFSSVFWQGLYLENNLPNESQYSNSPSDLVFTIMIGRSPVNI